MPLESEVGVGRVVVSCGWCSGALGSGRALSWLTDVDPDVEAVCGAGEAHCGVRVILDFEVGRGRAWRERAFLAHFDARGGPRPWSTLTANDRQPLQQRRQRGWPELPTFGPRRAAQPAPPAWGR
eukprot:7849816-Pyramimonas_sp.AAC.1